MSKEFLTYFTFENSKCICEIERVADNKTNSLVENLAIKKIEQSIIPMSYFYGDGLKISDLNSKFKNNILGEFLGIKKDDLNSYKSFFEKYGFLFNLENTNFNRIPIDKIDALKNNLLAFVFLLNNQLESYLYYKTNNIKELLDATLYLIFKNESELIIDDKIVSRIEKSKIMEIIENANFHNEAYYNKKQKIIDSQVIEYFEIEDSLSNKGVNEIDVEKFNNLLSGDYPQWFLNLCRVYKNKNQLVENINYHIVVDFLFHFSTEYCLFSRSDINLDGTFPDELYIDLKNNSRLLKALIKISKILLEDEFKYNLSKITPTFDVIDMKPDWKLPSLYTALYFSLFYMNNKENGFRKCANKNCGQYFQVSKTNSKKIYCSLACCNSVSQRKYRRKLILKKK